MHDRGKRLLSLCIGTSISLILLTWVLRGIRWQEVASSLAQAHWGWLVLGWLSYLLSYGMRAMRLGTLLKFRGHAGTFRQRFIALVIGFGANSVLPAHLGELIRANLLYRQAGVAFAVSIGSIFAERILDVGMVLMLLLLPIALHQLPPIPNVQWTILTSLATVLIILWVSILLAVHQQTQVLFIIDRGLDSIHCPEKLRQRILSLLNGFLKGLSALGQPQRSRRLLAESLLVWLLNSLTYWTGLLAFDLVQPGFWGSLFIQSGTALAIALPSTPGYLGPFEAGIRTTLGIYDIPLATLISYAIALRVIMYVTIPVMASLLWLRFFLRQPRSEQGF